MSLVNVPATRGGTTLAAQVAAILRKYGTDAHVYLPGIGVINGITAGNWLDSAGTTAATVDNPVGLVLDGANSQLGSELVTNGTFNTNFTGWNQVNINSRGSSVVSGEFNVALNSSGSGGFTQDIAVTVGKLYKVSITARRIAGTGSVRCLAYDGAAFTTQIYQFFEITTTASAVTYTAYVSTTTNSILRLYLFAATSTTGGFDNISVKEVTGIHAIQGTTANKPILRRGAVNLLTYSEQFDNAAWGKTRSSVTTNATTAPDGTLTADKLVEDTTASNSHLIGQTPNAPSATATVTASIYLKAAERGFAQIRLTDNPSNINLGLNQYNIAIDLSDGSVGTTFSAGSPINPSYTVTNAGNGWWRVSLTLTKKGDAVATALNIFTWISKNASSNPTYTGDGTSGIYIWCAQLQTGSVATDYIPTTTAPASSASGNYHWVHDSTDVLTATFPAGYESATTIDARSTGHVTLTAQNIVGAYNIGPSIDTYGRFIFRTGLTASELATIQTFANRLVGV